MLHGYKISKNDTKISKIDKKVLGFLVYRDFFDYLCRLSVNDDFN